MNYTPLLTIITTLSCLLGTISCIDCSGGGHKEQKTHITESAKQQTINLPQPTYNIFIENSASMYGYVEGVTEFEQSVYNYLSDMKIHELMDSMNLYYINSKPILCGGNISDFIEKLSPSSFKAKGGTLGTTDISNVLKMVLSDTNSNSVRFLISDFIFSPGKHRDAEQYLVNQQIGIKNTFANYLKERPEHAVLVYQLESRFDGYYYDKIDDKHRYKGDRPFYIWVIGHKEYVSKLIKKCPRSKFNGSGVKNVFSIIKGGNYIDYAVVLGTGEFSLDRNDPKRSIVKAKKDTKGMGAKKMRFEVNVDLGRLLCSDEYLVNPANYQLNDCDYDIEVVKLNNNDKYTHKFKLSTDIVKPTTLKISLKSKIPQWVEDVNDNDGIGITLDNAHKTYGFKYLVNGVYEAFTINGAECTNIIINVNK